MKNIFKSVAICLSLSIFSGCVPLLLGGAVGYAISEDQRRHEEWRIREQARLEEMRRQDEWNRWRWQEMRHGHYLIP